MNGYIQNNNTKFARVVVVMSGCGMLNNLFQLI